MQRHSTDYPISKNSWLHGVAMPIFASWIHTRGVSPRLTGNRGKWQDDGLRVLARNVHPNCAAGLDKLYTAAITIAMGPEREHTHSHTGLDNCGTELDHCAAELDWCAAELDWCAV